MSYVVRKNSARTTRFNDDVFHWLATSDETGGAYALMEVEIPVGGGPAPHVHEAAEEWFYVLAGQPIFHVGTERLVLGSGDFVRIPPGTTHWFEVVGQPVRVLASFVPGGEEATLLRLGREIDPTTS
ncbi:MAG TPA: cupin domain-containing protein [Micromonospora sp.]|nr:cupin domain-containing protein [Micromonospora sp.]